MFIVQATVYSKFWKITTVKGFTVLAPESIGTKDKGSLIRREEETTDFTFIYSDISIKIRNTWGWAPRRSR